MIVYNIEIVRKLFVQYIIYVYIGVVTSNFLSIYRCLQANAIKKLRNELNELFIFMFQGCQLNNSGTEVRLTGYILVKSVR